MNHPLSNLKNIVIQQIEKDAPLELSEKSIPALKKNEVLVEMAFCPINPSDLSFIAGNYAEKPSYPLVPGIEGSGKVIANGGGFIGKLRMGKTVALTSSHGHDGTWGKYVVTEATNVIPLPQSVDLQNGASAIVNPLTALSFIKMVKDAKQTALCNNAAGGALGKMLVRLCQIEGIDILSIVRSEKQKAALEELRYGTVLNSNESNFQSQLQQQLSDQQIRMIFDAVGGRESEYFANAALKESQIIFYANLSNAASKIDPRTILQKNLIIKGFFLGQFMSKMPLIKVLSFTKRATKLLATTLKTDKQTLYHPKDVEAAMDYYQNHMSAGKILFDWTQEIKI